MKRIVCVFLILCSSIIGYAVDFEEEFIIVEDIEGLEFSRNPQNMIQFSQDGMLHLMYVYPNPDLPLPNTSISYLTVNDVRLITNAETVNSNSTHALHPAMKVDRDGNVFSVWQDSRHATSAGNWIDNLEIYFDHKPLNGSFNGSDIRITNTNADHLGDNGYAPQLEVLNDGRAAIVWYDFHGNGNNANVYFRISDVNGSFPPVDGIEQFRITNIATQSDGTANWIPTITRYEDGLYLLWGFQAGFTTVFELRGLKVDANGNLGEIEELFTGGKFLDPPKLSSDHNMNIGMVYTNIVDNLNQIEFRYRRANEVWREAIRVNDRALHATHANLRFDSIGNAHIVWLEDVGGVFEVQYAIVDPNTAEILSSQIISSFDADARTPIIAIEPNTDRVSIAWVDRRNEPFRSVYMVQQLSTSIHSWELY